MKARKGGLSSRVGLYFLGNLSTRILSTLLVPLYAFKIAAGDLGDYDYAQTLQSIIVPILYITIWNAALRFMLMRKTETEREEAAAITVRFTVWMSALGAVLLYAIHGLGVFTIPYVHAQVLMIVTFGMAHTWLHMARGLEENGVFVTASVIGTSVMLLLNFGLVFFLNRGLDALFFASIMSNVSAWLTVELRLGILRIPRGRAFSKPLFKRMARYCMPLIAGEISAWFISGYGRMLVRTQLGAQMAGLYAFSCKFSNLVTLLGSVVTMALTEEVFVRARAENDEVRGYMSEKGSQVFCLFTAMLMLMAPCLAAFYRIIASTEYAASQGITLWLIGYAVLAAMANNVDGCFCMSGKTQYSLITSLAGAGTMILLSNFLIERWDMTGVAVAQLTGAAVMFLLRLLIAGKTVHFRLRFAVPAMQSALFVASAWACMRWGWPAIALSFLGAIAVAVAANRKLIRILMSAIRARMRRR